MHTRCNPGKDTLQGGAALPCLPLLSRLSFCCYDFGFFQLAVSKHHSVSKQRRHARPLSLARISSALHPEPSQQTNQRLLVMYRAFSYATVVICVSFLRVCIGDSFSCALLCCAVCFYKLASAFLLGLPHSCICNHCCYFRINHVILMTK